MIQPPHGHAPPTLLTVVGVEYANRVVVLQCQHPLLVAERFVVHLPAHVAKQLVGQIINGEGQNEEKAMAANRRPKLVQP